MIVLACGLLLAGCQIDTHAGMSEESTFWNKITTLAQATWFLDQTRAAIDKGDLQLASEELAVATERARRISTSADEPSYEFFSEMAQIVGSMVASARRELDARKAGNQAGVVAEEALRAQLNDDYRRLMSETDFSEFTMNEPDRSEVETALWGEHGFLDCLRMNKLAGNPQVFERCK